MAILRVQHSFQGISNLPKDQYVNTFHFTAPTLAGFDFEQLSLEVRGFYGTPASGQTRSISYYMSGISDTAGERVKMYDVADAEPREPLFDETYEPSAFGGTSGGALPSELAVCLSYKAAPLVDVPPGRLRGRLYLGPWGKEALETATHSVAPSIDDGLRFVILASALQLAGDVVDTGCSWSLYSPTRGAASSISEFWVDNAWDIIRGRGEAATDRQTALVP